MQGKQRIPMHHETSSPEVLSGVRGRRHKRSSGPFAHQQVHAHSPLFYSKQTVSPSMQWFTTDSFLFPWPFSNFWTSLLFGRISTFMVWVSPRYNLQNTIPLSWISDAIRDRWWAASHQNRTTGRRRVRQVRFAVRCPQRQLAFCRAGMQDCIAGCECESSRGGGGWSSWQEGAQGGVAATSSVVRFGALFLKAEPSAWFLRHLSIQWVSQF